MRFRAAGFVLKSIDFKQPVFGVHELLGLESEAFGVPCTETPKALLMHKGFKPKCRSLSEDIESPKSTDYAMYRDSLQ